MRSISLWIFVLLVCNSSTNNLFAADMGEIVETLEAIEVPGTAIVREERTITFLQPSMAFVSPLPADEGIPLVPLSITQPSFGPRKLVRDAVANEKGTRTPVRPAKAERPPYPRFAREQGWEGVVVLRLMVNRDGAVDAVRTQKSSGYSILDESAEQTVQHWQFEPAKDGEIPIAVTVDLPIRFDLNE